MWYVELMEQITTYPACNPCDPYVTFELLTFQVIHAEVKFVGCLPKMSAGERAHALILAAKKRGIIKLTTGAIDPPTRIDWNHGTNWQW